MNAVTQILPSHHKHCDDLFVAAENAVQDGNWTAAATAFASFEAQMQAHFLAEEDILFPTFESVTGMTGGPTQMMRYEHEQMRTLIKQMATACAAKDADAYADAGETMLTLLQQHNMKEENILYPMCEQALGGQSEQLGAKLTAALEEVHA